MTDLQKIKKILKKYAVKEAYLFGSYLSNPDKAKDIDLAITPKTNSDFFKVSSALSFAVSKPLDLIYLDQDCKFIKLVRRDGLKIHG